MTTAEKATTWLRRNGQKVKSYKIEGSKHCCYRVRSGKLKRMFSESQLIAHARSLGWKE